MAISSARFALSQRALLQIPPYFCSELLPSHYSCLCRLVDAVVALPSLLTLSVASSFEADAMMPMTPPNWRTMPLRF
ncbi:hypothetical protein BU64_30250 [Escherichia coli O128:H2 str. 2011C-3317]|nr:hypothetical protein BU64_30250 [Escherichia coli O128:H2 str. 2011C-3317]